MKHWYVPGVLTNTPATLPKARNLERGTEHIYGTSHRDALAFSYFHIKALVKNPETLQSYLLSHTFRLIFLKLDRINQQNYENLSHNERLDLALTQGVLTQSSRSLVYQIEFEKNPYTLLSVFVNFLKEFQKGPLEFQPLMHQLLTDSEIFEENEDIKRLNREIVRVL